MNWALDHPGVIIGISVVTALLTFPLNRMVGREFVPNEDMGEWTIHVDAPEGTSLEGTSEIAFKLLKELSGIEGVAQIEPSIGVSATRARRPTSTSSVRRCRWTSARTRRRNHHRDAAPARGASVLPAQHHARAMRSAAAKGPAASDCREHPRPGPGPDCRLLDAGAASPRRSCPSLTDAKITLNVSNPEIHVAVDRKRAADLGVRMATIGNTLRLAVAGDDEISFYKEGQEQYPVKIRVLENQRRDIAEIGRLTVPSANGPVRIDNIAHDRARPRADDAAALGPAVLRQSDRRRRARPRARRGLERRPEMLAGLNMPPTMSFKLQGQSKILDETTANLIMAIGLAMIFVYMVLAVAVRELPPADRHHAGAADRGAVRAVHAVATGRTLNLWSALGMLLLLGIVKKNSILQVDYANVLRARACRCARRSSSRAARGCGRS